MQTAYCEAIQAALDFEKSGEALYRSSIDKVEDSFARTILEFLANEETEHIRKIEAFNDAVVNNAEFDFNKECSIGVSGRIVALVKEHSDRKREEIEANNIDLDIYDMAMEMERRGRDIYEAGCTYAEQTDDVLLERFCEFMLAEEDEHYDLLASSKRYLEDPAYYFSDYGGWIFS
jgi:rubrerythrin